MTDPLRENIRIDKGVKRPRLGTTYKHKPVSPKADLGTWKIPEGLDPAAFTSGAAPRQSWT